VAEGEELGDELEADPSGGANYEPDLGHLMCAYRKAGLKKKRKEQEDIKFGVVPALRDILKIRDRNWIGDER
jgi:hypothetical protein